MSRSAATGMARQKAACLVIAASISSADPPSGRDLLADGVAAEGRTASARRTAPAPRPRTPACTPPSSPQHAHTSHSSASATDHHGRGHLLPCRRRGHVDTMPKDNPIKGFACFLVLYCCG
ncbi:hypothetical protein PR202_gb18771 [Eleusine coracana subsp. coracana]|uniref:Uncharacterized protein n=1 Tax=Eleusine coracana subsp. coracana TaxID=191504 RepID=A0AAV5F484_ELECO|nr:hypothetical protein PR202_gb18771 [Eleusine coracana subsp. coracana]